LPLHDFSLAYQTPLCYHKEESEDKDMNYNLNTIHLTCEKQQLSINLCGNVSIEKEERIRLVAIFSTQEETRRFLCKTEQFKTDEETQTFISHCDVSLPFVFFHPVYSTKPVKLQFEIQTLKECILLDECYEYETSLFQKPSIPHSAFYNIYRVVAFLFCILFLPMFLLDGYFAVKGYKKIDTGDNPTKTGKKAIFFHANALTIRICGYSYSPREWKTAYFNHCYERKKKRPIQANKVVFLSEREPVENSNLSCILKEFQQHNELAVSTYINSKTIDQLSLSEIRHIATLLSDCTMIILEDFYPQLHMLSIRPETKIVQLWHACGAFKTFGFSRLGKVGGPKQDSRNHRSYDYAFVSGTSIVPIYAEAFGIPDSHVYPLGVPRTDILFDKDYRTSIQKKLYQKYPFLENKRIVLFAPTFRGSGKKDAFYPEEQFCISEFMEKMPEDTVLLIKHHPFVKKEPTIPNEWKDRVFLFTKGENINDLLLIANLLITDYSSSIFEAALLQVPMLFYVFDKEEYMAERDIYYTFDSFVPGPLAYTQEELETTAVNILSTPSNTDEKQETFCKTHLDALDGNSTKRIAEFLISKI